MIPKIFTFDPERMEHVRFSRLRLVPAAVAIIAFGMVIGFMVAKLDAMPAGPPEYEELVMMVDEKESEMLSPRTFYEFMKEVGIKYPEIVWSQVAVETGFKSDIFFENNNLFGMKEAICRPNVQDGKSRGHATYRNWRMSVIDYALWQASNGAWKLKSETAYFNYLNQRYSEDPDYVHKVKEIRDDFENQLKIWDDRFRGKSKKS